MAAGQDMLLEIDWQGAQQVRKLFRAAIGVFVLPPSLRRWSDRLTTRGLDSADIIARRVAAARDEMRHVGEFDYVIINNELPEAIEDAGRSARRAAALRTRSCSPQALFCFHCTDHLGLTMARVTVDDCLKRIPNRFQMTLAATYRARQMAIGAPPMIEGEPRQADRYCVARTRCGQVRRGIAQPRAGLSLRAGEGGDRYANPRHPVAANG